MAVQREYPQAERLPIPPNIDVAEATRFSPLRNRDINATAIDVKDESIIDVTLDQNKAKLQSMITYEDPHLNFYDAQSAVNIGSVMQSTVPEPYGGNNRHTHLNMPGGSWGLQTKYLSHELNSSHYTQLRQDIRSNETKQKGISMSMCGMIKAHLLPTHSPFLTINKRFISLSCSNRAQDLKGSQGESDTPKPVESNKEKLKRAVKEYGSTVIIFHVGISLMSLGMFYALVSRYANNFIIDKNFLIISFIYARSRISCGGQIYLQLFFFFSHSQWTRRCRTFGVFKYS